MTVKARLMEDMKTAMKAREAEKLETIRYVIAQIKNAEIDAGELSDEQVAALLQKEVKKRRESIVQFRQGNREDLAVAEEGKIVWVETYLPQMMTKEEVAVVVDEVAASETDFGKVMGQVMARLRGKADGTLVSQAVKEKLQS